MQRVMAIAAEAKREGEAAVIMAQAEYKAAETYVKAAQVMSINPIALQLRYFQTLKEIAAEQNSTILVPSEVTNMFRGLGRWDSPMSYPSPPPQPFDSSILLPQEKHQ
jgi:regulator of protease activity HflC (stomatin/prohibitin superfamily)